MNNHLNAVCKSVHYHIRALRHIRSSISEDMAKMVACALVGSRLDYANSVLFGATQKKTSPNSKKHRTSLPVSLPVLLNPAVHVLGRLKMRDMKIRDGQKCRGGKCET